MRDQDMQKPATLAFVPFKKQKLQGLGLGEEPDMAHSGGGGCRGVGGVSTMTYYI